MAKNTEGAVSLEVVRACAEKIARDTGRSVLDLAVAELIKATGGSAGYVAAHLQTIKNEYTRAMLSDISRLPVQLVSSLLEVMETIQKNGEEVGRLDKNGAAQTVEQVCEINRALEAKVSDLEQELATVDRESKTEKQEFDNKLRTAELEVQSLTTNNSSLQVSLDKTSELLTAASFDLGSKTAEISALKTQLSGKDQEIADLTDNISEANGKRDKAIEDAGTQKQRADLLDLVNKGLVTDKQTLEQKLEAAINRAIKAEAQLEVAMGAKPPKKGQGKLPPAADA